MVYTFAGPALSQTFTPFTNSLGITDSKLTISYSLEYASGTAWNGVAGVVQSFSATTITVHTTDASLPYSNPMKLIASFAYNPAYTVEVDFTIIIDHCFSTVITPAA